MKSLYTEDGGPEGWSVLADVAELPSYLEALCLGCFGGDHSGPSFTGFVVTFQEIAHALASTTSCSDRGQCGKAAVTNDYTSRFWVMWRGGEPVERLLSPAYSLLRNAAVVLWYSRCQECPQVRDMAEEEREPFTSVKRVFKGRGKFLVIPALESAFFHQGRNSSPKPLQLLLWCDLTYPQTSQERLNKKYVNGVRGLLVPAGWLLYNGHLHQGPILWPVSI